MDNNIWNVIGSIPKQDEAATVDTLERLNAQLRESLNKRYSGISGALFRIYDWFVRNDTTIQNTMRDLAVRTITVLKNKLADLDKRVGTVVQQQLGVHAQLEEPNEMALQKQLHDLKQELTKKNIELGLIKTEISRQQRLIADQEAALNHAFGGVDEPKEQGQFKLLLKNNTFELTIFINYNETDGVKTKIVNGQRIHTHKDPVIIKQIITNLQLLVNKKYRFCSSKNIQKIGNFICFQNNDLFVYRNGSKSTTSFDLTKQINMEDLDKQINMEDLDKQYRPIEAVNQDFMDVFASEKETDENLSGQRTVLSREFFKSINQQNGELAYTNNQLIVEGQTWTPITSSTTQACEGRFASMGSSETREICTVDYQNSSLIQGIYEQLKIDIQKKHKKLLKQQNYNIFEYEEFVLEKLQELVITNLEDTSEETIKTIIDNARETETNCVVYKGTKIPLIPLDTFIKNKTGVCRHRAMLFLVLASQLKKEGFLLGETRQIRAMVEEGSHSWNLYCSPLVKNITNGAKTAKNDHRLYHIDAMWGPFGELTETSQGSLGKEYLCPGKDKDLISKLEKPIKTLKNKNMKFASLLGLDKTTINSLRENYKKDLSICLIRRSNQFSDIYVFEIQSAPTPISISIHKKHFSFRVLGLLQKKFTPLPYTTTKDSNQDLEAFIKQELPEGILRVLLPTEKGMEVFSVKDGWKSLKKS